MAEPATTGRTQSPNKTMDDAEKHKDDTEEKHAGDVGSADETHPKKRRRTAKPNADKKYECKHDGCGKSYSRAEHLYRHQLNHTPKTIYRCDYPDCNRYFVRQDLCVRHRERHTTHGSQLHKRDAFAQASATQTKPTSIHSNEQNQMGQQPYATSTESQLYANTTASLDAGETPSYVQHHTHIAAIVSPSISANEHKFQPPAMRTAPAPPHSNFRRNSSTSSLPMTPDQGQPGQGWNARHHSASLSQGTMYNATATVPPSPIRSYSATSNVDGHFSNPNRMDSYAQPYSRNTGYVQNSDVLPVSYSSHDFKSPELSRHNSDAFAAAVSHGLSAAHTDPYLYSTMSTQNPSVEMGAHYNFPVFTADDYNRSPFTLGDDFTAWLFNDTSAMTAEFSPNNSMGAYSDNIVPQIQGPLLTQSPNEEASVSTSVNMSHPMSVSSILDSSAPSSYIMSEAKRLELLDVMENQFVERPHDAVKKRKDSIFEGDTNSEGHILSLRMMHTYIGSYWYHQHAQLPILHKPTFSADKTPTLLLLAVLAIGAATLDKAYGTALTDSAAEFANFLAWHLRWEIIRDADFRPPAKLWVFQTLLLIEVYEKMYSTRALHERAHIHHDSTLTLIRRGSSLINRSASDSPPSGQEDRIGKTHGTNENGSKSEESWMRWVTTEATRRAAFGAFVIDSIHCTMFGHSAKMVAHEMRLPLPCDEALWSATSPAEVGRVQTLLQNNGIKPILFLEGLKRTLNGQGVRTNSFGRTILMSGLLSVSWHMTQRDLQIASIGPPSANSFRGPDKWKSTLLRAFDNWKRDFDEALAESAPLPSSPARTNGPPVQSLLRPVDDENIFESRTVLHHLAHIAAHVDIIDCQVFAGANRLLSRTVTPRDYSIIRDKIEKWATRASARDSAFYALKFISQVLVPPESSNSDSIDSRIYGHATPILPQAFERDRYIARDDFLLNRPWVLYVSALVVWCYGFALEGPITPRPKDEDFATYEQREKDMREFLTRVAGVRAPDDLEKVTGKNGCLGLLLILQESFESTRWELTHEAAGLLGNAANKLKGAYTIDDSLGHEGSGQDVGTRGRGVTAPAAKTAGVNGHVIGNAHGHGHGHKRHEGVTIEPRNIAASMFNTIRP